MKDFFSLIDRLNGAAEAERAQLEDLLAHSYQRDKAVLALDMSGFSLTVRRTGIVNYLCTIRRMQQLMEPLVPAHGGELVKFEADNLLAVFDEPRQALAAALAMVGASQALPVSVSIGLDFGPILLVPARDCYGDAVNVAYKLGEDVARPGEILLTHAVARRLGEAAALEALELSIAGIVIPAFRVDQGSSCL